MVAGENKSEMQLDFRRQEDKNSFSVTWNNYDHFIAFSTIKHCRISASVETIRRTLQIHISLLTEYLHSMSLFLVNVWNQVNNQYWYGNFNGYLPFFVFLKAPFIIHNLEKLSRHVDTDRPAATGVPSPSSATPSRKS